MWVLCRCHNLRMFHIESLHGFAQQANFSQTSRSRWPEYITTGTRGGKKRKARDQLERSLLGPDRSVAHWFRLLRMRYCLKGTDGIHIEVTKLVRSRNSDWHPVTPTQWLLLTNFPREWVRDPEFWGPELFSPLSYLRSEGAYGIRNSDPMHI